MRQAHHITVQLHKRNNKRLVPFYMQKVLEQKKTLKNI